MTIILKNKILFITPFVLLNLSCTPLFSMEKSNKFHTQEDNPDRLSALPEEIQQKILGELDIKSLVQMSETNKYFHNQAEDENLWKELCRQDGIEAEPDQPVKKSYISQNPSIKRLLKKIKEIFDREEPVNLKSNLLIKDLIAMIDENASLANIYEHITQAGFFMFLKGTFEARLVKSLSTPGEYKFNEGIYIDALWEAGIEIIPQQNFYDSYRAAYKRKVPCITKLDISQLVPIDEISYSVKLLKAYQEAKAVLRAFILAYEKKFDLKPSAVTLRHFNKTAEKKH